MAAVTHKLLGWNLPSLLWRGGLRLYSQYSPMYQEPIVDKKAIEQLIAEEPREKLLGLSVKACRNSLTTSVFYDPDIDKFINYVMRKGKKAVARRLVEDAFRKVKHTQLRTYNAEEDEEKKKEILLDPREVYRLAVKNVTPLMGVTKVKKSGTWYTIPVVITDRVARTYAMKWIVDVAKTDRPRSRSGKPIHFEDRLAQELLSAAKEEGKAYQKKIDLHKLCEANRGYAHYKFV